MDATPDRSKSLQELEGTDWGEPTYDSHLVTTCQRLRRKPLSQFSTEDLRIMIGQEIGLPLLIPLALELLDKKPLASGDLYAGDLLAAVASVKGGFWHLHANWLEQLRGICKRVGDSLPQLEEEERNHVHAILMTAATSIA